MDFFCFSFTFYVAGSPWALEAANNLVVVIVRPRFQSSPVFLSCPVQAIGLLRLTLRKVMLSASAFLLLTLCFSPPQVSLQRNLRAGGNRGKLVEAWREEGLGVTDGVR